MLKPDKTARISALALLLIAPLAIVATVFCDQKRVAASGAEISLTPSDNVNLALRSAVPGNVYVLEDGDYLDRIFVSDRPGLEKLPIVIRARNPGKVVFTGVTGTRVDAFAILRCPWWRFEGIVFENGTRAGLQIGASHHVTVKGCVSRDNGIQGILASGNYGTVEDTDCYGSAAQHGLYVTGATVGWKVLNSRFYANTGNGVQFNNQGTSGFVTNVLVQGCSMWGNGAKGGAGINLIGVRNSKFEANSIHDNLASGIALSGGCSGNLIVDCIVTFKAGQGRQCVTATDPTPTTNTVVNCILRMGKSTVPAVEAKGLATIVQSGNTVLPVATVTVTPPAEGTDS